MSNFQFSNLYGSVYSKGNVLFSKDGFSILSPVGNRVTVYDLKKNLNFTFEPKNKRNIRCMALAPDDNLLLTADEEGFVVCSSLKRRIPIHFINLHAPAKQIMFSPDSKYFAVAVDEKLLVYNSPSVIPQFWGIVHHKRFSNFLNKILCFDWSDDSQFLCAGASNMIMRIVSLESNEKFKSPLIVGFRNDVVSCYFEYNSYNFFGIDSSGLLIRWTEENNFWKRDSKHVLRVENFKVICSSYQKATSILVLGYDSGLFCIFDTFNISKIQQYRVSDQKINSLAINSTSDWIAFASSSSGQLIVWEYKNESYILKQQGHTLNMRCVDYSPSGLQIVTGSDDGKVKIWEASSGFCVITFNEHTLGVSSVKFSNSGRFILSASLDGTCRCFDLNRYRNFRTLVTSKPVQFSSISIDGSDELVCASAVDVFDIFVWSVMTGRLLETISGHLSPVSNLIFLPNSSNLVSCAWDKTVKLWDIINSSEPLLTLPTQSECLCISVHPFDPKLSVCTTRAHIIIWDFENNKTIGTIEGSKDLGLLTGINDDVCAETLLKFRFFTSLAYSPDGELLFAAGKSIYICIYCSESLLLLNRIQVTNNLSLDKVMMRVNTKRITEAGPIETLEDPFSDDEKDDEIKIPGSIKHDLSVRKTLPELSLYGLSCCPTGRTLACVSTEGLLLFSKNTKFLFDPIEIDPNIKRETIESLLKNHKLTEALVLSVKLGEHDLICKSLEAVSFKEIRFVSSVLPINICIKILEIIAELLDGVSPHLEFYFEWCNSLLMVHGLQLKNEFFLNVGRFQTLIRKLQKCLKLHIDNVGRLCESNLHSLRYLSSVSDSQKLKNETT